MAFREPAPQEQIARARSDTGNGRSRRRGAVDDRPRGNPNALRRLFPYLRPYLWHSFAALLAVILAAAMVLGLGNGLRHLIDSGFAEGASHHTLDMALGLLIAVVAMLAVASFFRLTLVSYVGEKIIARLRDAVFRKLLTLDIGWFETTRTGDIVSRLTNDATSLQVIIGTSLPVALRSAMTLLGGLVMLVLTSAKLTMLVLVSVPVVVVPIIVIGRRVGKLSRLAQDRIGDVSALAEETIHALRTVQASTAEEGCALQFEHALSAAVKASMIRIRVRAAMSSGVILIVFSAIALVLWQGGLAVLAGEMSAGQLSAFVFYAILVAGSVGTLSEVGAELSRAGGAAERLFEILDKVPEIAAPPNPVMISDTPRGEILFEKVTFAYLSRLETAAIEDFSLNITSGERVALVGPSGAGKSTLLGLIQRFHDPLSGRICLDGVDLRQMNPRDLRQHLAIVPQEPVIFAASALDNIRFGKPDATEEQVHAAATAAFADDFIRALPEGYASFLGERGVRLSGGEKQRIAIARAILRNPLVLLLDEATSALDSTSEAMVQRALDSLMQNRTSVVVAHRLATVQNADRIIVLDKGRIVETGTHPDLVAQGGLYASLAAQQFRVRTH